MSVALTIFLVGLAGLAVFVCVVIAENVAIAREGINRRVAEG